MKKLITHLILSLFILGAIGCNPKSNSEPEATGGTSGGGGNTVTASKISRDDIESVVSLSKPLVLAWLTNRKRHYDYYSTHGNSTTPLDEKIYGGSPNILDQAKNLRDIELRNGPCLNDGPVERDGSIYGKRTGSICLSISRLTARLNGENYQNQIAALIVHELGHLAGTTEEESVKLQEDFLYSSSFELAAKSIIEASDNLGFAIEMFQQNLVGIKYSAQETNLNGDCDLLTNTVPSFFEASFPRVAGYLTRVGILSEEEQERWFGAMVKLHAASDYACGYDERVPLNQRNARKALYESYFENQTQMLAVNYPHYVNGVVDTTMIVSKITDNTTYSNELLEAAKVIEEATSHISSLYAQKFETYTE